MDAETVLKPYKSFMESLVGPYITGMAESCGHNFKNIAFKISSSPHPEFSVNPTTSEIFASKGAIDALQGGELGKVSREFKAVIAHEVAGHVGHHKNLLNWGKFSVFASPLIAVAAYELIRRNMSGGASREDAAKAISDSVLPGGDDSSMNDHMYNVAKYVAIGALGLAAGGFLARYMSRAAEFAADRRAVEFTKDPEALVSALTKLQKSANKAIESASAESQGVAGWLEGIVSKFRNATYHAHPDVVERAAYVRSLR